MTSPDSPERGNGLADAALRRVTREVTRVPLLAVSVGMQAWERSRGLRERAVRSGGVALELAAHTPLGRFLPQPVIDDDAAREGEAIAADARKTRLTPVATPPERIPAATTNGDGRPTTADAPSRAADEVPAVAKEAGAPGAVTDEVEEIAEQVGVDEPQSRDELPIPDFDNITIGSLRARLRSLSLEQLVTLREWEQAHAHRLPVITLLDNRIAKVSAEQQSAPGAPAYPAESTASTESSS